MAILSGDVSGTMFTYTFFLLGLLISIPNKLALMNMSFNRGIILKVSTKPTRDMATFTASGIVILKCNRTRGVSEIKRCKVVTKLDTDHPPYLISRENALIHEITKSGADVAAFEVQECGIHMAVINFTSLNSCDFIGASLARSILVGCCLDPIT